MKDIPKLLDLLESGLLSKRIGKINVKAHGYLNNWMPSATIKGVKLEFFEKNKSKLLTAIWKVVLSIWFE